MAEKIGVREAYKIHLSYQVVPQQRATQEEILRLRGYTKLQGRNLSQCDSRQIYTVAQRVFKEAYHRVQECENELVDFLADYRHERSGSNLSPPGDILLAQPVAFDSLDEFLED